MTGTVAITKSVPEIRQVNKSKGVDAYWVDVLEVNTWVDKNVQIFLRASAHKVAHFDFFDGVWLSAYISDESTFLMRKILRRPLFYGVVGIFLSIAPLLAECSLHS